MDGAPPPPSSLDGLFARARVLVGRTLVLAAVLVEGCGGVSQSQQREAMVPPPRPDTASALADLRSDDPRLQNRGAAAFVDGGPSAAAAQALMPLLEDPSPGRRAQAMYVLSRIGGAESAGAFLRGLSDGDERVRAYSAVGLVRTHHPAALEACLRTLNDASDDLHSDHTPAADAMVDLGLAAVSRLLDVMVTGDEGSRLRASRALEGIVSARHGFRPGRGFPSAEDDRAVGDLWRANGDYDYAAGADARRRAVELWRRWLDAEGLRR